MPGSLSTVGALAGRKTIWSQCVDLRKCIKVFLQEFCIGVKACLSVVLDGGTYYVEVSVNGNSWRWPLTNACYTVYSIGIGNIDICVEPIQGGVRLEAKACISVVGQCWTIYGVDVHFFTVAQLKSQGISASGDDELLPSLPIKQLSDDDHIVIETVYEKSGLVTCNCGGS